MAGSNGAKTRVLPAILLLTLLLVGVAALAAGGNLAPWPGTNRRRTFDASMGDVAVISSGMPGLISIPLLAETRPAKRESFSIIATILGITADGGVGKTHLMYKSNLDYKQLSRYIAIATESGLLLSKKDDNNRDSYHLTEKGKDFLQLYGDLQKLMLKD